MDDEPELDTPQPPKAGAGWTVSVLAAVVATFGGTCCGDTLGSFLPDDLDLVRIGMAIGGAIGGLFIAATILERTGRRHR